MSFSALVLDQRLNKAIKLLGYSEATAIQQQAIPVILSGKDVMAGAQTGTGKTAAFALPILQQLLNKVVSSSSEIPSVSALILTPTRELALQVSQSFQKYGQFTEIKTVLAYGGVSIKPQIAALTAGANVLVATPGRLLDHLINGSLSLVDLQYLVFDEADRMLDMGFKDEINNILKRISTKPQTLLFSATFDQAIFKLSKTLLNEPALIEVTQRNTAASQVEQVVYSVDEDRKRELTSHLIGSKNWQQVLIFTRTKKSADELAKEMSLDGLKTQSIHGDKSQGAREKALIEFKQGKTRALVATDVAARGLDIQALNYVINYELPYVAEDYIHRIGRTGRAGNNGLAISLVSSKEEYLLTAIEEVLDTRLLQQWLSGYEPDLTKVEDSRQRSSKGRQKQKARKAALSKRDKRQRR